MDLPLVFILYLTLFRLAIIAAGIISLVLGYRLFCRGVWPSEGVRQDGEREQTLTEARIIGARFTLKNAAPGTAFALFGVVIIVICPNFVKIFLTEICIYS